MLDIATTKVYILEHKGTLYSESQINKVVKKIEKYRTTPVCDEITLGAGVSGYEDEMNFVMKNAQKNETKGLSVQKVVSTIIKADSSKNPKLSYTVGKDAFMAHLISKLPQKTINSLVKFGLKARMKK